MEESEMNKKTRGKAKYENQGIKEIWIDYYTKALNIEEQQEEKENRNGDNIK